MELTFNGHACVTLRGRSGKVIITDPYLSGAFGGRLSHAPVTTPAQIVTISHYHIDHSHVSEALGEPEIVDKSGQVAGIDFLVRPTYHDRCMGTHMGMTGMTAFELDGLRIAHLGDIGCELTAQDVAALGDVDILLWPVGGTYTLGPEDAPQVLNALKPRLAIPMHYEGPRCQLGMAPIEALVPVLNNSIKRPGRSSWSSTDGMPTEPTTLILEPAR